MILCWPDRCPGGELIADSSVQFDILRNNAVMRRVSGVAVSVGVVSQRVARLAVCHLISLFTERERAVSI